MQSQLFGLYSYSKLAAQPETTACQGVGLLLQTPHKPQPREMAMHRRVVVHIWRGIRCCVVLCIKTGKIGSYRHGCLVWGRMCMRRAGRPVSWLSMKVTARLG